MSKVYFTKEISPESVLRLYEKLVEERGGELCGRVAVKLHSGEVGNQNFLPPDMYKPTVERVGGVAVECNTAYEGSRNTTERHIKTLMRHGFSDAFPTDILDKEQPDLVLPIPDGKRIKKNFVGRGIENYDSILVISHFKGHPMGGYGGALKQLSIGFASSYGKQYIHGVGFTEDFWTSDHDSFLMAMADAAKSVMDLYRGKCAFINVMKNMSVDCDCCAKAEDPCMNDIGVLASLDPVAVDFACLDLVYGSDDPGKAHLIKRIESRNGLLTPRCAEEIGIGTSDYQLIDIDEA